MVESADLPFERRPVQWNTLSLPVAADLLVYTADEWQRLQGRFKQTMQREAVWVTKQTTCKLPSTPEQPLIQHYITYIVRTT